MEELRRSEMHFSSAFVKFFFLNLLLFCSLKDRAAVDPELLASNISVDGVFYRFDSNNKTATVTYGLADCIMGRPSYFGSVTIPSTVEYDGIAYRVTSIGNAFENCPELISVTLPNSITFIGRSAFGGCKGLTSVIMTNNLTSIGQSAFSGCSSLVSIVIPESVTSIGSSAFKGCSRLTSVNIPNTVTSIDISTFEGCCNLGSINIPPSVTSIGSSAFAGCGLVSVTIPQRVTSIGNLVFFGNKFLTDIICYAESVPAIKTNVDEAEYDGGAFNDDSDVDLARGVGNSGELVSDYSYVTLHVPSGSVKAYAETAPWNKFKLIIPIEEDDLQDYLNSLHDTQDLLSDGIYTRQFLNTDWQSLYVPFSLSYSDWCNNFEVASLSRFCQYDDNADGVTDRHELEAVIMRLGSDVLKANTPYLIRAKKTGTYNFTVNPSKQVLEQINSVTYSANGSKMVITGNYTNQSGLKSANRYRLMGGSLFIPTQDDEVLPPYRWYATIENSDKAKVRITFVDDATGIESIRVDNEEIIGERKVYDLSGRCINISKDAPRSSLPKGVYIIDNKKIVIK